MVRPRVRNAGWLGWLSAAVALLALLGLLVALLLSFADAADEVGQTVEVKVALDQLEIAALDSVVIMRAYLREGKAEQLERYDTSRGTLRARMNDVRALTYRVPAERALAEEALGNLEQRMDVADRAVTIYQREGPVAAEKATIDAAPPRLRAIRETLHTMKLEEDRQLAERRSRIRVRTMSTLGAIAVASVLLGFAVVGMWTSKRAAEARLELQNAERDRLHAENEALAARSHAAELQERFVAILGHDLRTPVTAMMLGIETLKRWPAAQPTTLTRLASSAARMNRMIEQLLELTRTRLGGGLHLDLTDADLGRIVNDTIEELKAAHPAGMIDVTMSGHFEGRWDADRLTRVVTNLIGNALQHGAVGRPVRVELRGDSDQVTLVVQNDGPAIPANLRDVLFDPFRRGAGGHSSGLGLGLFIAKSIVSTHGGTLDVSSSDGAGTTFVATFPREIPEVRDARGAQELS